MGLLLSRARDLVTADSGKAGDLMPSLPQASPTVSQASVLSEGIQGGERPAVEEGQVRGYLRELDPGKSIGPNGLHPQVLREQIKHAILFERSWRLGEVPKGWRKTNVKLIFKKGQNYDLGNHRPLNLPSVTDRIMD